MRFKKRKLLFAAAGCGAAFAAKSAIACRRRMFTLRGKSVLITGGSRGLGLLLAREFARQGCRVAICARDAEELERARIDLKNRGADVWARTCDVGDADEVGRFMTALASEFGSVDVLVNNAGIIQVGPVSTMSPGDYEKALQIIFWGALNMIFAVLPQMRERRSGRIVNITSIGGKVSVPHLLPYGAAKFALMGLSEGLRAELAPDGIVVTTIVPGLMRTGSYLNALFKGRQREESTWFGLGASLPFISMDAERAARQIVRATRRGDAERILSLPAALLARLHGLCPGTTMTLLELVNWIVLPKSAGGTTSATSAKDLPPDSKAKFFDTLTYLGRAAAERFNEV